MKNLYLIILILLLAEACNAQTKEEISYRSFGRCDGCNAVFEYGDKKLISIDTFPDYNKYEPKIKLTGTIYKPDGKTPAPNVILYAYHTNPEGKYPKNGDEKGLAKKQGYIRGWVKTDSTGRYTIYTFLPGSYSSNESHIHTAVLEPDGKYYYIDDFNFEDDPHFNITFVRKKWGGFGIVKLRKEGDLLLGVRDIILGYNVENYE